MVYIVGGKGFVGSAVVRACARRGLEYRALGRDDMKGVEGTSCDLLINANGNSKKYLSARDPVWDFDASVRSVRENLASVKVRRYIHLSSCDVYPDCSSPSSTSEDVPLDPAMQSVYGFHKYLAELCVRHCAPEWVIFRMGGFVGEGLVKNAIYDILNGGTLRLHPDSALQFMDVDAAAAIIVSIALNKNVKNEVLNLCGDGVIRLQEAISAYGKEAEVNPGSPLVVYDVSIEKIKRVSAIPSTFETVISYVERTRCTTK